MGASGRVTRAAEESSRIQQAEYHRDQDKLQTTRLKAELQGAKKDADVWENNSKKLTRSNSSSSSESTKQRRWKRELEQENRAALAKEKKEREQERARLANQPKPKQNAFMEWINNDKSGWSGVHPARKW